MRPDVSTIQIMRLTLSLADRLLGHVLVHEPSQYPRPISNAAITNRLVHVVLM